MHVAGDQWRGLSCGRIHRGHCGNPAPLTCHAVQAIPGGLAATPHRYHMHNTKHCVPEPARDLHVLRGWVGGLCTLLGLNHATCFCCTTTGLGIPPSADRHQTWGRIPRGPCGDPAPLMCHAVPATKGEEYRVTGSTMGLVSV
jgi:hypothetical protein